MAIHFNIFYGGPYPPLKGKFNFGNRNKALEVKFDEQGR